MMRKCLLTALVAFTVGAGSRASAARNFQLQGNNELSGGIGFAANLTDFTPGGFKWFNDYGYRLSDITWLNLQLNVTLGGNGCRWRGGREYCDDWYYNHSGFSGDALELAGGVKLKWRMRAIPLQIHAKFGGALDFIWFPGDFFGVAPLFRGAGGVRYFFVPTLGVGGELCLGMGPGFFNHDAGVHFVGSIDFNMGVEWRF